MLTSTTSLPFSTCKQRHTVNEQTFHWNDACITKMKNGWGCDSLKEHREAVLTFRRYIQCVPCQHSQRTTWKCFSFHKENAAIDWLLEKIFSSLKLNACASITFCVPSASFFLRLKMTWNRSFKSITSGSACMETNTKKSLEIGVSLSLVPVAVTLQAVSKRR